MRAILSSPRRRRRFAWVGALLLVVAAAVGVGIRFPNTAPQHEETPVGKPHVYREPKAVRLSDGDRKDALATAAGFVRTAVLRKDTVDSWPLTAPELRQGFTRKQWSTGEIPVVPYPLTAARWKLDYSYPRRLGLKVLLFPAPRSELTPTVFNMELKAFGKGAERHWLVNYWAPAPGVSTVTAKSDRSFRSGLGDVGSTVRSYEPPLGTGWIFVPIALFGSLLLVPLAIGARGWYRGMRAKRSYAATLRLRELPSKDAGAR